ncbi:biosynthetic-type acetolactate synthase large subunit [Chakrabartyella piscis]|uniref:biosynthetic-type acetolactate synthase large subunit n=1 Tax=Chakrabartyella piscis TaxID=2918914 RepID=UPI00295853E8|nr:biosynthetic-type acetolactate synthase large subunit [Chakrabartyella piscis]
MHVNGSQLILEIFKDQDVDTLFVYPGGVLVPFFDELYHQESQFHIYRPAHEQNGVHAADGYARSTGKLGVFVATSGPGATNTITGIATAYMDSVPLLIITGQVTNSLIGKDSFQEIDITGLTMSITKHNYLVRDVKDLQKTMEEAIRVATTGRPGPVLVDIPKDVFLDVCDYLGPLPVVEKEEIIDEEALEQAIECINAAKKPVIYAGGGIRISKTEEALLALAEKADIPVVNSFMGIGTIDRNHKLSLGFVGMHGLRETNIAVSKCDLLFAIGARFSDRVVGNAERFAPGAAIIHMDIDETEFDKNTRPTLPLLGDFKTLFPRLLAGVKKADHSEWLAEIRSFAAERKTEGMFTPDRIIETINGTYPENTVLVTDVGQHQMWSGQFWKVRKGQEFVTSGGLGTMGFGLGAAIGAQIGNPNKNVVLITGDGCFRMSNQEMVTMVRYELPIRVVMFNNRALGMVRQWQKLFNGGRYSQTDIGADLNYVMLAQAYGITAAKTTSLEELDAVLEETKDIKGPVFIECEFSSDYNVFPIVPPGKGIDEFVEE